MKFFDLTNLRPLSKSAERELTARLNAKLLHLLPLLGPLFGLSVLAFSLWDYFIDPAQAATTLKVRIVFVLLGSLAYVPTEWRWSAVQRYGYMYWTQLSAIIICEFMLKNGFLYGLADIAISVFLVSIVTLEISSFLLILSVPTLLFIVLSAIGTSAFEFINGLLLYFFSVMLAGIMMLVIRSFHKKAFLLEKSLLHECRHDGLTGACNRIYLEELADHEIAQARQGNRALAVAMLDIDHFKLINDTYGHDVGDRVIISLVDMCTASLREIDHFGRMGGEEFACVLLETDENDAMRCAERLRLGIEAICMETPQGALRFTISIGIALLGPDCDDWDALLKNADAALYRAKREGRNRTVLAAASSYAY